VRHDKIGIATSLFKDNGFNSFDTIDFAVANGIKTVQLYMSEQLEKDNNEIERIRQRFTETGLEMIVHSPYYLNKKALDSHHLSALKRIFPDRARNFVVFHYDENSSVDEAIATAEDLTRAGLTVALENYYQGREEKDLRENINGYTTLIKKAMSLHLDLVPVFDIPRLFIEHFNTYSPAFLTKLVLHSISTCTKDIILHIIDTTDVRQRREDWVPIGEGMIPYNEIFATMDEYKFNVLTAILEFESVELGEKSLSFFDNE